MENGLVAVTSTEEGADEDCSICFLPFTFDGTSSLGTAGKPVRTPCNHVFCTECLMSWLMASNTCPMCRRALFFDAQAPARQGGLGVDILSILEEDVASDLRRALKADRPRVGPGSDNPALTQYVEQWLKGEPIHGNDVPTMGDQLFVEVIRRLGIFEDNHPVMGLFRQLEMQYQE